MYRWTITCVIQVGDWWGNDENAALRASLPEGSYVDHRLEDGRRDMGRVVVQMSLTSQSVGGASQQGNSAVYRALKEIRRGGRVVIFHAENADTLTGPRAELAGTAEAADILQVAKSRVSELAHSAGFPEPLAVLASGPVWEAHTLRQYATVRSRTGGRPRKDS